MGVHKRKKRLNQRYKQRERLKKKTHLWALLSVPMDGGAWWAAVHGVAEGQTRLSDFTFTFHFHALEKEMAPHPSVLAWRIPGTGEPGGLPSMGSHRVGYDWSDLAAAAAASVSYHNSLQFFTYKKARKNMVFERTIGYPYILTIGYK